MPKRVKPKTQFFAIVKKNVREKSGIFLQTVNVSEGRV